MSWAYKKGRKGRKSGEVVHVFKPGVNIPNAILEHRYDERYNCNQITFFRFRNHRGQKVTDGVERYLVVGDPGARGGKPKAYMPWPQSLRK